MTPLEAAAEAIRDLPCSGCDVDNCKWCKIWAHQVLTAAIDAITDDQTDIFIIELQDAQLVPVPIRYTPDKIRAALKKAMGL